MKNLSRVALVTITTAAVCSTSVIGPVSVSVAAQSLADDPASGTAPPVVPPPVDTAPTNAEPVSTEPVSTESPADQRADTDTQSPPTSIRDTAQCQHRLVPPPAVDTSEMPAPGQPSPSPLPVADTPAGGAQLAGCDVILPEGFVVPEGISASSWAVIDVNTGDVIAAKDPHGRYRPASVIKVLLALVVLDELRLDQKIPATYDDAAIEGSRAGIVEGNIYSVKLLLQGLLMNSGNDCGNALIRALGGHDAALQKINNKARALGATDTRVGNPTGLDAPGQSTSAFDLGLFYAAAFTSPQFTELAATTLVTMPGRPEEDIPDFEMSNDNQLLSSGYEGALGGKTGYTDDARHTFVGAAERDGRRLVAVVLDATAVDKRAWQQAAALLDAAFATAPGASVGNLNIPARSNDSMLDDAKDRFRDFFKDDSQPQEPVRKADGARNAESGWFSKDAAVGLGIAVAMLVLIGVVWRGLRRKK